MRPVPPPPAGRMPLFVKFTASLFVGIVLVAAAVVVLLAQICVGVVCEETGLIPPGFALSLALPIALSALGALVPILRGLLGDGRRATAAYVVPLLLAIGVLLTFIMAMCAFAGRITFSLSG